MNILAMALARSLKTTTSLESVDDSDVILTSNELRDEDGAAVSPLSPVTNEPIIEAQETELQHDVTEISDGETEIDSQTADIETLESIQNVLSKSLTDVNSTMTNVSYEMLNINMDHIYRKYGITSAAVMPSMEAFNGDVEGSVTVSMERVKETINTIGLGAQAALKKLLHTIKNFILNVIKFNFSMLKRIDAVSAKAKEVNYNSELEQFILHSGNKLNVKGKVPDKLEMSKYYLNTAGANDLLSQAFEAYFKCLVEVRQYMRSNKEETKSEDIIAKVEEIMAKTNGGFNRIDRYLTFQDAEFITVQKGLNKAVLKFKTSPSPERGQDNADYKITPLTCDEIVNACTLIKESCEDLKTLSGVYSVKDLEKNILNDERELRDKMNSNKLDDVSNDLIKQGIMVHSKVISYVNTINKAMLDYCVQSLNANMKASNSNKK